MKKTLGFCILILSLFLFFSCASDNNVLMKDVYAGYYSIAEEYFKMEKYAKLWCFMQNKWIVFQIPP